MQPDLNTQFTLLIPTYNRQDLLKRLLNYLKFHSVNFSVLVLDSSEPSIVMQNAHFVATLPKNFSHIAYPNDIPPFKKFSQGLASVSTPFCGFCADDDIIFINTIADCVDFLTKNPTYSLAHGLYFDFLEIQNEIYINRLLYASSSLIDDSPVHRTVRLIQNYEATTYAIHRTESAKIAFQKAAQLPNILFNELLSSLLCVVNGKAARLPKLYCGRNTQRTITYSNWHPIERIATAPAKLFSEYAEYRQIILEALKKAEPKTATETQNFIDVAHLCYLSVYLRTDLLNDILNVYYKTGHPPAPPELWQRWAEYHSYAPNRLLKQLFQLKSKIMPTFSFTFFMRQILGNIGGDFVYHAQLPNQKQRRYCFTKAFMKQIALQQPDFKTHIQEAIHCLSYYH